MAGSAVQAQDLPSSVTTFLEQLAEAGGDTEELVRYYEGLMASPLNVNAASRTQLEELRLLSLFQVESLLAWRERYGAIRSAAELSLVEGFSAEQLALLRPFIAFGEPSAVRAARQTYTTKVRKKWKQEGFSLTTKGLYDATDFSAGTVIDNDPKERFPDYLSLSARYKGIYAGDFTARFGQGLVVWKAFNLSAFGTPASVSRRGGGLREHRGTDESNFFRGAGWTHAFKALTVTGFASYMPLPVTEKPGCRHFFRNLAVYVCFAARSGAASPKAKKRRRTAASSAVNPSTRPSSAAERTAP